MIRFRRRWRDALLISEAPVISCSFIPTPFSMHRISIQPHSLSNTVFSIFDHCNPLLFSLTSFITSFSAESCIQWRAFNFIFSTLCSVLTLLRTSSPSSVTPPFMPRLRVLLILFSSPSVVFPLLIDSQQPPLFTPNPPPHSPVQGVDALTGVLSAILPHLSSSPLSNICPTRH